MASFFVNGKKIETQKNISLLRFLRDELHITSVKDGCSEGACGACTVIIDGKTCRACTPKTYSLEGKHVLTVEGLCDWEKKLYTACFGIAGAVQCGFCIPGMVLCTKALLDENPDPTEQDIRNALRNNYCRCTGYIKIFEAVRLAAKYKKLGKLPEQEQNWQIGSRVARLDVEEKVLGFGQYPDDRYFDGMLYASCVRAAYPRARVLAIDAGKALALDGVERIITAADIPGENLIGHIQNDQYTLVPVGSITHYRGDGICIVVAKDADTLEKAKKLVRVEYEVLPCVNSPFEAMKADAPRVFEGAEDNIQAHRHVCRGNADEALKTAPHVITRHFQTPWTEHAFLEPECAVAYCEPDGTVCILSSDQSAHTTLRECCRMLGTDKVRVENQLIGGGFGGKEDMSVQHHAALAAYLTKKPVKVKLSRAESLLVHPKRHPFWMDFSLGCDENGKILAVKAKIISDTGAFASLGGPVLERACTHAAGPYAYENFEIDGTSYYTNNPPAGAFRGFGVTQSCFAMESMLNEMAQILGISEWEIRMRNAIRPGGTLPNGQIVGAETGLVEALLAIRPYFDEAVQKNMPVGLACAMKNAGVGVGLPDWGRCRLIVGEDEKLHIHAGASCIGQGLGTVLVQMAVSNTALSREQIVYERSETRLAPDSGDTSGSRQTLITGEALRRACEKFNASYRGDLKELVGKEFFGEYFAKTDPLGCDKPNPVSHVAYGYAAQMVVLDRNTGKIAQVYAAHNVGKAINPLSLEGQIEGGVVMSLGFALRERYPIDEECRPIEKFGKLGLLRAHEVPPVKAIIVEKEGLTVANGAIGIGEITSIPTAAAVSAAYYHLDGEKRFSLPLANTPYERKD